MADIAVLNSHYIKEEGDFEGLGLVLLEAQAQGLPVIGTNSGGIPEAIDMDRSGFIIPEKNINQLSEKILLLMQDSSLYQQMSKSAIEFVASKFSWQKNIEKYIDMIAKIF